MAQLTQDGEAILLSVLRENENLRRENEDLRHKLLNAGIRIRDQAELLERKAERKTP